MSAMMLILMETGAFAAQLSEPVMVDSDVRSSHWATIFTNAVDLAWDWNTNATSAQLKIVGMNEAVTMDFNVGTSNYLWQTFASDVPSAEDVYDLTLTFYKNVNVTVGALTSRLVLVRGAFGATAVNPAANGVAWSRVKENVVIPYNADWNPTSATNAATARLVIAKTGGLPQTNALTDIAGYYGWKIRNRGWGYGTFDLLLTFPETAVEWSAELMRPMDGTLVKVQ